MGEVIPGTPTYNPSSSPPRVPAPAWVTKWSPGEAKPVSMTPVSSNRTTTPSFPSRPMTAAPLDSATTPRVVVLPPPDGSGPNGSSTVPPTPNDGSTTPSAVAR